MPCRISNNPVSGHESSKNLDLIQVGCRFCFGLYLGGIRIVSAGTSLRQFAINLFWQKGLAFAVLVC